jgi:Fic family protein
MKKGIKEMESNNPEIEEFLEESNAIEQEYSTEALEDAKKAWDYAYKNRKNIDLKYILKIHRILMQRLRSDIAGKVRDCTVYIGGEIKHRRPKKELHDELKIWAKECEPVGKKATEKEIKQWHINFEFIHPFQDGNGRVGRILWQIQRINNGHNIKIIHEGDEQYEYYKWF